MGGQTKPLTGWKPFDIPLSVKSENNHSGEMDVTVCIAAMCDENIIFAVSDQMLTAGDIQFQPQHMKAIDVTTSILALIAGDAGFQAELFNDLSAKVNFAVRQPDAPWLKVQEVAEAYVACHNAARNKRIEARLLSPLGLTYETFLSQQRNLAPELVSQVAQEMVAFDVPFCSTIFCGVDETGAHIFTVNGGKLSCEDNVGFSAIGSGGRHAESLLMTAEHSRSEPLADTLFRIFSAKKRAEVAPGVGDRTNLFMVGPALGSLVPVRTDVLDSLERLFKKQMQSERKALEKIHVEVREYIDEINRQAQEQHAQQAAAAKPPAAD
tara:strand:+ start:213 stop:1184 length:972 start_codon:yes stop_codon:yes gene_type:complete